MFNTNINLLEEAFDYSVDNSFLEQYASLDDMVQEMIYESYEDMLRFAKFQHNADMIEGQMIIQQESVSDIVAFQEGVFKKAKNFVFKIIDKIKLKWRKFCIWINKKVASFLAKRVVGMKAKADKSFDSISGDLPTVKYASKSQSAATLFDNAAVAYAKISFNLSKKAAGFGISKTNGGKSYLAGDNDDEDKERSYSMKKDFEEEVLGDIESTEISKNMWNIDKDSIKGACSALIKSGDGSIAKTIKETQKIANTTYKFADKDDKNYGKSDKVQHNADVNAALNATNKIISAGSAAMSCFRKICWMALKAAASARVNGGSSGGDYRDEDDTREDNRKLMQDSAENDDDLDLSVF